MNVEVFIFARCICLFVSVFVIFISLFYFPFEELSQYILKVHRLEREEKKNIEENEINL